MVKHRKPKIKERKERKVFPEEATLLDQFSDSDVRVWADIGKKLTLYEASLYRSLELQRAAIRDDLCDALREGSNRPFEASAWIRVVDWEYSLGPLSSVGSLRFIGGRFNIGRDLNPSNCPPFNALYLAEDLETGLREKFSLKENDNRKGLTRNELSLCGEKSISQVRVNIFVQNIFDLNESGALKKFVSIIKDFSIPRDVFELASTLGIAPPSNVKTVQELYDCLVEENWRVRPTQFEIPSNSQIFGALLREAGFEGVLFKSTKGPGLCLSVFPTNFAGSNSYIELADDPPKSVPAVVSRLDSSTWKSLI